MQSLKFINHYSSGSISPLQAGEDSGTPLEALQLEGTAAFSLPKFFALPCKGERHMLSSGASVIYKVNSINLYLK